MANIFKMNLKKKKEEQEDFFKTFPEFKPTNRIEIHELSKPSILKIFKKQKI